jgi:hypothetical protein
VQRNVLMPLSVFVGMICEDSMSIHITTSERIT